MSAHIEELVALMEWQRDQARTWPNDVGALFDQRAARWREIGLPVRGLRSVVFGVGAEYLDTAHAVITGALEAGASPDALDDMARSAFGSAWLAGLELGAELAHRGLLQGSGSEVKPSAPVAGASDPEQSGFARFCTLFAQRFL